VLNASKVFNPPFSPLIHLMNLMITNHHYLRLNQSSPSPDEAGRQSHFFSLLTWKLA